MNVLNIEKLKYNPKIIKNKLRKVKDMVVCDDNLRVIFPTRYITRELATMGSVVNVISYFAIIDDNDNYAVILAPIMMSLLPFRINEIFINDVSYQELIFDKGHTFSPTDKLVQDDSNIYTVFDEFFIKGKIPWYITYENLSKLFLEAGKYAGSKLGKDILVYEMLTAIISRDVKDKTKYYRQVISSKKDKTPYVYIGLNNVYYSFDNTASKLVGGYYGAGVTAAVVNKEKKTTVVADMLRA